MIVSLQSLNGLQYHLQMFVEFALPLYWLCFQMSCSRLSFFILTTGELPDPAV